MYLMLLFLCVCVKHFELRLCVKCATQINLPCLYCFLKLKNEAARRVIVPRLLGQTFGWSGHNRKHFYGKVKFLWPLKRIVKRYKKNVWNEPVINAQSLYKERMKQRSTAVENSSVSTEFLDGCWDDVPYVNFQAYFALVGINTVFRNCNVPLRWHDCPESEAENTVLIIKFGQYSSLSKQCKQCNIN